VLLKSDLRFNQLEVKDIHGSTALEWAILLDEPELTEMLEVAEGKKSHSAVTQTPTNGSIPCFGDSSPESSESDLSDLTTHRLGCDLSSLALRYDRTRGSSDETVTLSLCSCGLDRDPIVHSVPLSG